MDYVFLPKPMHGRLLDVKVCRGEGGGMSDHFWPEAKIKMVLGWRSTEHVEVVRSVFKVSELNGTVSVENAKNSIYSQFHIVHIFKNLMLQFQVREFKRTPTNPPGSCAHASNLCFVVVN